MWRKGVASATPAGDGSDARWRGLFARQKINLAVAGAACNHNRALHQPEPEHTLGAIRICTRPPGSDASECGKRTRFGAVGTAVGKSQAALDPGSILANWSGHNETLIEVTKAVKTRRTCAAP